MAYAYVTEFECGDDRSAPNFDAFVSRMFGEGKPDGALHYSAGFDDDGVFRTYPVWQSSEHRQRFAMKRLEPFLAEGPVDPTRAGPPNRQYGYELHYATEQGVQTAILRRLDDPADGPTQLRSVLLPEHEWRVREGLVQRQSRDESTVTSRAVVYTPALSASPQPRDRRRASPP